MKRFLPKFLFCFGAFITLFAYYRIIIYPNLSGEFGVLGQIPFGKEYNGLSIDGYKRGSLKNACVKRVRNIDSLKAYQLLTIGDSFSQYYQEGYQQKLSHLLDYPIGNLNDTTFSNPIQSFIDYANSGCFNKGQIIIVECVERHLIERLYNTSFEESLENHKNSPQEESDEGTMLNMFLSWIRLNLKYDSPVGVFELNEELFSHPKYSSSLFVYNSKKTMNGDLLWTDDRMMIEHAMNNLKTLHQLADARELKMVFLIAADKYDVYEPWIDSQDHPVNPTLDYLPE